MEIRIQFFSYFKELTGTTQTTELVSEGATVEDLMKRLQTRFPTLAALNKSMLIAVGVEYAERGQALHDGDEVALFPPVQGG